MFRNWLGRTFLRLCGWRVDAARPTEKKFVVIAAPHTSNWDAVFMLAGTYVIGIRFAWMGKHTLFKPPQGWLFSWLGGLPVDRRAPGGVVGSMIDRFARTDEFILAVPPEGTRGKTEYWKSGFYHIAEGAHVPICLGYLDYANKVCGLGPMVMPSGDMRADMDRIRAFYADKRGKYPAKEGPARLREEEEGGAAAAPHG